MKKLTIEQRDEMPTHDLNIYCPLCLRKMKTGRAGILGKVTQIWGECRYGDCIMGCTVNFKTEEDLLLALNANTEESNRTFSGEFEPETELAELTQFNGEGKKIAHFVYCLPDLNPQPKQESKKCPECGDMLAQMFPEPDDRWSCPNCGKAEVE